jgi:hypothetical protein
MKSIDRTTASQTVERERSMVNAMSESRFPAEVSWSASGGMLQLFSKRHYQVIRSALFHCRQRIRNRTQSMGAV